MRYCVECGAEHQDSVSTCADCGAEVVTMEELGRRGLKLGDDVDTRRFVRAGTAEDPLTADRFTALLQAANIPVFLRGRRSGPVDLLTGASPPWWELLVPEAHAVTAAAMIDDERERIERNAEEAAHAAEAEERETEALESGELSTIPL